jgi:Protein of unknown function (DUF4257)
MQASVLSSFTADITFAILFGILGGFMLGLLQDKGLEMPHLSKTSGVTFVDAGFLADMFVGAAAAALTYALNPPTTKEKLFAVTFTAGIGGSGILKAYIKGTAAREQAKQAALYRAAATDAAAGTNVQARLSALHVTDQEIQRRFGPR